VVVVKVTVKKQKKQPGHRRLGTNPSPVTMSPRQGTKKEQLKKIHGWTNLATPGKRWATGRDRICQERCKYPKRAPKRGGWKAKRQTEPYSCFRKSNDEKVVRDFFENW